MMVEAHGVTDYFKGQTMMLLAEIGACSLCPVCQTRVTLTKALIATFLTFGRAFHIAPS